MDCLNENNRKEKKDDDKLERLNSRSALLTFSISNKANTPLLLILFSAKRINALSMINNRETGKN